MDFQKIRLFTWDNFAVGKNLYWHRFTAFGIPRPIPLISELAEEFRMRFTGPFRPLVILAQAISAPVLSHFVPDM